MTCTVAARLAYFNNVCFLIVIMLTFVYYLVRRLHIRRFRPSHIQFERIRNVSKYNTSTDKIESFPQRHKKSKNIVIGKFVHYVEFFLLKTKKLIVFYSRALLLLQKSVQSKKKIQNLIINLYFPKD